ncbi:hypothetical protein ACFP1L_05310 [Lactiplantibacillus nangangensis]|uniref:YfhO family protein n=1 Tax=Lactiplantibacillus nangangensis TaxID=2559917 RepID=A0ABW1SII4_9LACO|nr:hypothetical protein [Lactiplantibacillus nangangensis]
MRHKNLVINFRDNGLFLLIVLLMLYPLWQPHQLVVLSDWSFHAARVEEILHNLTTGHWLTSIATRTFQGTGVGSFLFYPTPLLYLWAGLRLISSPLTAFFIWLGVLIWLGLMLSFYCCYHLTHRRRQALIFTLAYNLLPYRLMLGLNVFTLAEFVATLFLPLVFLGFYQLLNGRYADWPLLAIGMTLIGYTHLLTAILTVEIMIAGLIIYCLYARHFSRQQCWAFFKSILLCNCLTLPIIVPFLTDFIGQSISTVAQGIAFLLPFNDVVLNSIGNQLAPDVGLLLLLPIICFSRLNSHGHGYQLAVVIGVLLMLLATGIFPWPLLSHTSLAVVQMPYRYLSYAGLFLAVAFSKLGDNVLTTSLFKGRSALSLSLILVTFGGLYFGEMATTINRNRTGNHLTALAAPHHTGDALPEAFLLNNQNYHTQFAYRVKWGETDYFPQKSLTHAESIIRNQAYLAQHPVKLPKTAAANKVSYTVKVSQHSQLDLPIVRYRHTTLTVDGHKRSIQTSSRGTVQTSLTAGIHRISVSYQPSIWLIVSYFIAGTTWLGLVLSYAWHRKLPH